MLKKILVTLDGSKLCEAALPLAKELLECGAEATLFTVGEAPRGTLQRRRGVPRPLPITGTSTAPFAGGVIPASTPQFAESKDQAVQRLEHELLEYLNEKGRPLVETGRPVHAAVHIGDPAKQIIAFARREKFDLIVMATHGRSGLRGTLQGSVTSEVLRSGVAPVLAVRPRRRKRST